MPSGSRVTLADVAADAGVSRSTASLVLRGGGRLSDATRRKVTTSMERLGYVYHRGAASLRLQRSEAVGLLVTDITHPFFAEMALGLERALERHALVTMVSNTFDAVARQDRLLTTLLERQIDGLVLVPAQGSDAGLLDRLDRLRVPYLLTTRYLPGEAAPYLGPDDLLGGELAAGHLIEHGATRMAYLGGPENAVARKDRVAGFRRRIAQAGPDVRIVADLPGATSAEGGRELGRLLLEREEFPDGIICHSDTIAFGLYRVLRDLAPGRLAEVRVIGFDDLAVADFWEPPLTSVSVHPQHLGELAAETLHNAMAVGERPTGEVKVRPELVVRRSCGCGSL
ncbi:LacI family DNA-binding transcriptional regulator [Streptomyces sp. NPDC059850]|uniref:LacI family DNA-binding transcriptional regulator n=1 Tax=Streptomyces sp. NPDC059850 TaxID=3346970 RepID=UPI0036563484